MIATPAQVLGIPSEQGALGSSLPHGTTKARRCPPSGVSGKLQK